MSSKKGILLLNIGSPESYEVQDVKKYLSTFLMDKDVINLPFVFRWPLVNLLIVPRRAPFSAENYRKVWMEGQGSPLTVYTRRFQDKLQAQLGPEYVVKTGMRYAEPSIDRALSEFVQEGITEVLLTPLFPQYAEATSGSSIKEVRRQIAQKRLPIKTKIFEAFFEDSAFIDPSVRITQKALSGKHIDHYLFSFHGLPESHILKIHNCLSSSDPTLDRNSPAKNCYRCQCFATARAIAKKLEIPTDQWSVSFQSRLGRAEWLKPATDHTLETLAKNGKKNVAVLCPSFVADCIETLEEIGLGGQELFKENGGQEFHLVPCVNEDDQWVSLFADLLKESRN